MYVPDDDNYIVDGENYAPPRSPNENNKKKDSKTKQIIILVVVAIVLGLLVYFISSLFFSSGTSSGKRSGVLSTTLSVDDPEVESLYEMVTYGRDTNHLNKFLKEQSVMLRDFSNYEKYYYALSFLRSKDLESVEDEDKEEIPNQYTIEDDVIDGLMKKYFGDNVSYLKQGTLSITLGSALDEGNSLSLTYNVTEKQYEVTFQTMTPASSRIVPVALYGLESASRDDDTITLVERVIYLSSSVENNVVNYDIYRDSAHTMLITSQDNIPLEEYQKNPITIEDYMKQGNIITYQFKEDNGKYYFYRSRIEQ